METPLDLPVQGTALRNADVYLFGSGSPEGTVQEISILVQIFIVAHLTDTSIFRQKGQRSRSQGHIMPIETGETEQEHSTE